MIQTYDISQLRPYINWPYFFFAWQVKDPSEKERLRQEAEAFLDTIPMLRQQEVGSGYHSLADYVAPMESADSSSLSSKIGLFATSADMGLETDFASDDYQKMMAQLLADRLAEAAAEVLHEQVRKHLWGYAPDENLSIADMLIEKFQGIRPAVGYPSLPDTSLNFVLDDLLDMKQIGIRLTESGAMKPHASVSGLMLAHPEARYFNLGKIGEDQAVNSSQGIYSLVFISPEACLTSGALPEDSPYSSGAADPRNRSQHHSTMWSRRC